MRDEPRHALILFAHGARDAGWSSTLLALRCALQTRMPSSRLDVAYLEFQPPTLSRTLEDAVAAGCTRIDIAPIFWASGGHVASDLPPLLEAFRSRHPHARLAVLPVLSELPGMAEFIVATLHGLAGR